MEAAKEEGYEELEESWDTVLGGLEDALPDRKVHDCEEWLCEYGVRTDDRAMVFQFFPKRLIPDLKDKEGKGVAGWSEGYGMPQRLERALKHFDPKDLNAKFIELTNSFNVIIGGLGESLDPGPQVKRFFDEIEAPLP